MSWADNRARDFHSEATRAIAKTRDGFILMKGYETPQALRRALEDRLPAQIRRDGGDVQRLRRQTAFDRLRCRLFHETNPPWLLKGGYARE